MIRDNQRSIVCVCVSYLVQQWLIISVNVNQAILFRNAELIVWLLFEKHSTKSRHNHITCKIFRRKLKIWIPLHVHFSRNLSVSLCWALFCFGIAPREIAVEFKKNSILCNKYVLYALTTCVVILFYFCLSFLHRTNSHN